MNPSGFHTANQTAERTAPVGLPRKGPRRPPVYKFTYDVGDRLGTELTVIDRVSAGPFTEIYRVWSRRRLCQFACKMLRPGLEDPEPHRRSLATEAAVLRRVQHPNVVRGFPSDPDLEHDHVLMEHLEGPSLFQVLAESPRRKLKPNAALRIAVALGAALQAVHAVGFVYRDLKPANVIMRGDAPILVDFGAVYRWNPNRRPSERVGTDPYMAPEQVLRDPLSPRTDVFGLGALTYEMLTGEWPFEDQLMNVFDRTKLHNRFPQIAHAPGGLRRRIQGMGAEVEGVVHRCLARDPGERYESAADAVTELNGLLDRDERVFPGGSNRAA